MANNAGILLEGQLYPAWEASHDPDAIEDFSLTWGDGTDDFKLETDTIASSLWAVETGSGLVLGTGSNGAASPSNTTIKTTFWLIDEGNAGIWEIINTITTAAGRTWQKTRMMVVEEN